MKIVAIEPINMSAAQVRRYEQLFNQIGHQFVCFPDRSEDPIILKQRLKHADVAIVSNIRLNSDILSSSSRLKLLSVAFTGLDHIDLGFCYDQGIEIMNTSGYATTAVAELTVGLIIDLYRRITFFNNEIRNGGSRKNFLGKQMRGKTAGIIGTGLIGKETALSLKALGCKVIAWDKIEDPDLRSSGIPYYPLDELLSISDIISLHLPLNEQTENLISAEKLELCQPNAILINTARGKIVNTSALAHALRNGIIAGAAIDVFDAEPPLPQNHPLLTVPNCILLPHVGYATCEAFDTRIEMAVNNVIRWLKGQE
ncbi:MAG: hydroxyacid dehydrogenase [Bacteroidales bacterium]|jgi:D-3-phosphoglycerate dehydrogenase|nr:hydroxyacid dehydrogenase [Bacteroidales bacterium]